MTFVLDERLPNLVVENEVGVPENDYSMMVRTLCVKRMHAAIVCWLSTDSLTLS